MAKWSSSDTGILRKKNHKEKHDDLLVFGYACKLFRDDEKALYIDQGKHLIPWMGNNNLRIDRYDGRGTLAELTPFEASKEGYDTMRWLDLSKSERELEQLCDEERYYSLHTNEDDEKMYKEEEVKRNQQKNKEFQYNYDVSPDPQNIHTTQTVEEEDKPFVPPQELDVPADIEVPKTMKENARIEKTAIFVSQQGPQMEILIKAKQSDNPQFNFMNQNDPLFKYYRHILSAIKNGRYKLPDKNTTENRLDDKEQESNEDHYLHPSLLTSTMSLGRPVLPPINYKPSADCTYSKLVNRIQGNQIETTSSTTTGMNQITTTSATSTTPNQMTYEQQQYYQYYYTLQYYEYYKQMAQYQGQNFQQGENNEGTSQQLQDQFNQMNYAQLLKQQNPYAQIVTNISQNKDSSNLNEENKTDIAKAPVIYGPPDSSSNTSNFIGPQKPQTTQTSSQPLEIREVNIVKNPQIKPLVHYGSDSGSSDSEDEELPIKEPPDDIKVIIDKMASYVSKNGTDFEVIVKSKGDPRFEFLNETHEFHSYYKFKIKEFSNENAKASSVNNKEEVKKETQTNEKENVHKIKEKKIITPVSFSIKKPKEHDVPKEIKSALPIEESDEEIEEKNETSTPTTQQITTNVIQQEDSQTANSEKDSPKLENKEANKTNGIIDVDDPILEMIDLTDDSEEKRDARRAEDRIKDKLAAAAREKLASASRDRALQLERKKRAAAFLKLKSAETDSGGQKDEMNEIRSVSKVDDKVHTISDSDNSKDETDKLTSKKSDKRECDSTTEDAESRRRRKISKKRKSHKRRSKSKHDYRHKKSKKRRRRSQSFTSNGSLSS